MRWFRRREPAWKVNARRQLAEFDRRMDAFNREMEAAGSIDEILAVSEKYIPQTAHSNTPAQASNPSDSGEATDA